MKRYFSLTLALYMGKRYMAAIFSTTLVLGTFIFLLEILEMMRKLGGRPDIANQEALKLVLLKMPDTLLQAVPFIFLLGTLFCFARMSRNQEITALRTAGLPARSFLIPPLLVCLGIGLFNVAAFNPFAAATLKSYERLHNEIFPGSTQGLVTEGGHIWLKQRESGQDTLIYARSIGTDGRTLNNTTLFIFDDAGKFHERLDATTVTLGSGELLLEGILRIRPGEQSRREAHLTFPSSLKPEMIRDSFTSPNTLSVWELPKFIELLRETGFPSQRHEMHWQRTLAMPALALAMFLLAAPFTLHFSRHHGTGKLLVAGMCFGFIFHFFTDLVGSYGLAGRLDLALAAWMPTLIAGLLGIALFLHFREE